MINIRRAELGDAESISFLGKKTFDQSFGHLFNDRSDLIGYLDDTFSKIKIENSIAKYHNMYWYVHDNDMPVGYAKLQLNAPSEFIEGNTGVCKLQKIYFLKSYASQGIGGKLQNMIFDEAIEHGNTHLWLSALKENKRAVVFYERNNYKIVGEHPFTIGKQQFDFWVMSKKLV
ncbi:GNAT family N-acetyltransferase [Aquimarina mytili]|uniref:GNAT family N-acetyltransferase n=1 Tax=Aquimarina mytili TaxID=874423 RepID=A0A936ZVP8_9FLAO|nr:GNAT family N-acetyltransferase [Aquimarina mytili]MBL0683076.1 GNAT family N-acetyltransferase [Aquimarina mytili]